jgi:hypothetical protein
VREALGTGHQGLQGDSRVTEALIAQLRCAINACETIDKGAMRPCHAQCFASRSVNPAAVPRYYKPCSLQEARRTVITTLQFRVTPRI